MEDCSKTISQSLSLCHRPAHPPSPDLFPIRFTFLRHFFLLLQYFIIPSCDLFPSFYILLIMKSLTLPLCHNQTHPPYPGPLPFPYSFPIFLPIVLEVKATFQFLIYLLHPESSHKTLDPTKSFQSSFQAFRLPLLNRVN